MFRGFISFVPLGEGHPSLKVLLVCRGDGHKLEVPDDELMQQLGAVGHTFDYLVRGLQAQHPSVRV